MFVTGLTGGIATGKSTVSQVFQEAGAILIDADKIAHAVVAKGQKAWEKIVAKFGREILQPDGEIDRLRLGDIIFHDTEKKRQLNNIVHPEVFTEMARQVDHAKETSPGEVIILDVPLLIESGMHTAMSDVVLVYTPEDIQLKRLMDRDACSQEAALARIRSQMPIEDKRLLATIIIDNSASRERTHTRTLEVYRELKNKLVKSAQ